MDRDGTQETWGTHAVPAPRPAGPPAAPPHPGRPPAQIAHPATAEWLSHPRPTAAPGLWRYGYAPRVRPRTPERASDRALLTGMLVSLLSAALVWSLWSNGYVPYKIVPLKLFTPDSWWWPGTASPRTDEGHSALKLYDSLVFTLVVVVFGRLGNWPEGIRHFVTSRPQPRRGALALLAAALVTLLVWTQTVPVVDLGLATVALVAGGAVYLSNVVTYTVFVAITVIVLWPFARISGLTAALRGRDTPEAGDPPLPPPKDPAPTAPAGEWPELRAAGRHDAADRLTAEVRAGRMSDVDCARVRQAWAASQHSPMALAAFTDTVLSQGAAAWTHPSGARDLPERTAYHDLLTTQVRIGTCVDGERNPFEHRGSGAALDPAVLGTSLIAVGPPGAGKTARLVRPAVESLALLALTGAGAVAAVCAAGTPLGPDGAFDVVVRPGDPASVHDLDLYAGTTDPDEAAAFLAEGLVGDVEGVDDRRATTALAQLLGPFHAARGRFPTVPELAELLGGAPPALDALRSALDAAGDDAMLRELDARARQASSPADPGLVLADRLAVLDRPAFAGFFGAGERAARSFSLRAMAHHPLRVRIDLPEQRHEEAARLLTRLLLAQFTSIAASRTDRRHFACLVLDDATHTLTPRTVRGIQRLRSVNAGVVLALRTIGDVPEALHGALHSAVGCRMAFSGVSTWDGRRFAEAWGTQWVETTEVAKHTVFADQPMTRAIHALRKLVTGREVTRDAVTVRQVERERWSASELAHEVPPGHAVVSFTAVDGEHAPPLLVDLRT
ncbi:ATP/GTP-binding protein [Streptomyces sp. TS71-3]|uniref:ATP/GTP-binding protein n=1 Tax=Streptomyces sp. TS71-3 TaxID=2733862 RepID=UPI001BB42CBE|nr:ATP/GTP-binding protein [Streptomyces sp. TS71-3]